MSPPRVYHSERLQVGRDMTLDRAASHHLTRVLRLGVGDAVVLFDGTGGEYRGSVRSSERDRARVRCETFDPVEREAPLKVGLAQVISSGDRIAVCSRAWPPPGLPTLRRRAAPCWPGCSVTLGCWPSYQRPPA